MKSRLGIATTAAIIAISGAAHAQENADFCADLEQVVAAGRETPIFASLPVWSRQNRAMLAFEECGVSPDRGSFHFVCAQYDPARLQVSRYLGASEVFDILVSRIEACRPDALRGEDDRPEPIWPPPRPQPSPRNPWGEGDTAFLDIEGVRIAVSYIVTSRFTRLELEAFDRATRAADEAENRRAWCRSQLMRARRISDERRRAFEAACRAFDETDTRD